jgi:chromosome segregation ATPase
MREEQQSFDEEIKELEILISRLRIEYEQFFRGAVKREPTVLRGKVQKIITRFVNEPPRSSSHKFRFNALNARYQAYRNLWGRTQRELETGSHRSVRFRERLQEAEREEQMKLAAQSEHAAERAAKHQRGESAGQRSEAEIAASASANPLDRLHDALLRARQQTGESTDLSRERIAELVRKQTESIRARAGPEAKVKFRVVIEDNKAKLKASVS